MIGRKGRTLAATTAAIMALGACADGPGAEVADKTGGETVVLRMATIDGDVQGITGPAPQAFLDSLAEISDGRLKVEVTTGYGDGAADAESRLVEAIASGALDGGWPATRAFAAAGIEGLEAVEAPMTITSYAAANELVRGPVADSVIAPLDGSGVVGLGLAVAGLRRPFAADTPLLGPEDWQGIRFRSFNSPTQSAAISALGAEPVNLYTGWQDQIAAGSLRGVEIDVSGEVGPASNGTGNVVLWPKISVFSLSQKRYDALSEEQREWVQQAAGSAMRASVEATWDESTKAAQICDEGGRFVDASPEELAALQAAWRPVIDDLAADPESGSLLGEIQTLAEKHPQADVLEVPPWCRRPSGPRAEPAVPDERSALPDGVYRSEITLADVEAAGYDNGRGFTGTWTLRVEDGSFALYCQPLDLPGRDCGNSISDGPFEAGHLRGTGNTVYFVYVPEVLSELTGCQLPVSQEDGYCWPGANFQVTWNLDGELLTFSDPVGAEPVERLIEPWQRIG